MLSELTMHNRKKRKNVFSKVAEDIKKAIKEGKLAPGVALPSENILAREYQISRPSVRLALRELESQNLIVKKHGKGAFVKDNMTSVRDGGEAHFHTLGLHIKTLGKPSYFYSAIIYNHIAMVSVKRNCRFAYISQDQIPFMAEGLADCLITMHKEDELRELFDLMSPYKIEPLAFNRIVNDEDIAYVAVNYIQASKNGMAQLLKKGHKCIGWMDCNRESSVFMQRYRGMLDACNEVPSDIKLIPCPTKIGMPDDYYEEIIFKFLENNRPSAFYIMNGSFAIPLFNAARRYGIRIPDDLEILFFDRVEELYNVYRSAFMYINMPLEQMAEDAANYLIDRLEQGSSIPVLKKLYNAEVVSIGY